MEQVDPRLHKYREARKNRRINKMREMAYSARDKEIAKIAGVSGLSVSKARNVYLAAQRYASK